MPLIRISADCSLVGRGLPSFGFREQQLGLSESTEYGM